MYAYASAYATLTPLQCLITRAYVDSPCAIGLRKLTRLWVSLTQAPYDTTPSTHIKVGFRRCPDERHINWQECSDIELAQVLVCFQHGKICSMLCSVLLGTGIGKVILFEYWILEAIKQQHQQLRLFPKQGLPFLRYWSSI